MSTRKPSGAQARPARPGRKNATTTEVGPEGEASDLWGEPGQSADPPDFPVVGVGASAGGVEALNQLLGAVPEKCGMAFVVILHLDPSREGIMSEVLQRATPMKVQRARDGMRVRPDCVYVIPENRDMTIEQGQLRLCEPTTPRGLRLPIDIFFRSLAAERKEHAIGVVLSGMGSDGTLGLRAIKERAGLTLAQEPVSAGFDSMPRSAIEAGVADIVASAPEMAARILAALRRDAVKERPGHNDRATRSALDQIMSLLLTHTGQDFSLYKTSTVYRRIERRMVIHQIDRIARYIELLRESPLELELLFKELLIGVTNFFRDAGAWEFLRLHILPALVAGSRSGTVLRAWVAGCSTGEEAYSLAMTFKEVLEEVKPQGRVSLQIFATDLDATAISHARQGIYPAGITADVSARRLQRWFVSDGPNYRVCKEIREMVIFAVQNVIMDPPFTKLDLLLCRNLLIYLKPELQKRLLPLFHYALNRGGTLFLGSAETVGPYADLFAPTDAKSRLFSRVEASLALSNVEFPTKLAPYRGAAREEPAEVTAATANLPALADALLLQRYSPAALLVNEKGDILYINGRTGRYLEPAAGRANWNLYAMAREGLRHELPGALQKAQRDGSTMVRGIKVENNGDSHFVDLTVEAISDPVGLRGMLIVVFSEVVAPPPEKPRSRRGGAGVNTRVAELEHELQQVREELQSTREEMQSSQEELKSANEELQSANEELQSSNEELTTSKEEMQSLNEELQTVNAELQSKLDELSRASSDMRNLLDSTEIATVFLDNSLNVRRFSSATTRIINLIPSDVGRPLSDIVSELAYPALQTDAREVLRTLVFSERQVSSRSGKWYNVRIMPYRTTENVIDGLVITFTDITVAKGLEQELKKAGATHGTGEPNRQS